MTSQNKTAGWVSRLLGLEKAQETPATKAEKVKALDAAAKDVSKTFAKALLAQSREVKKALDKAAKKMGVDPKYLVATLLAPSQAWPPLSPLPAQYEKGLELAKWMLVKGGHMGSVAGMHLPPLELEDAVEEAFKMLAVWMQQKMQPKVKKAYYIEAVEGAAKKHQKALKREDGKGNAMQDAASQISAFFKHRLSGGSETSPDRLLMLLALDAFKMLR